MGINILTSGFPDGFTFEFSNALQKLITKKGKYVFVASDFKKQSQKTDKYAGMFLQSFSDNSIVFEQSCMAMYFISRKKLLLRSKI